MNARAKKLVVDLERVTKTTLRIYVARLMHVVRAEKVVQVGEPRLDGDSALHFPNGLVELVTGSVFTTKGYMGFARIEGESGTVHFLTCFSACLKLLELFQSFVIVPRVVQIMGSREFIFWYETEQVARLLHSYPS